MGKVLVVGSSNMDLVWRGDRLPMPGETVLGSDYFQAFGGKGANQAVAAARAGADVTFLAAVGDDSFGSQSLDQYRLEKLNVDYIRVVRGKPSGVALIFVDAAGQNMIAVYSGANAELSPDDIFAVSDETFGNHAVLVTQLETPVATVQASLRRAKESGIITLLNPAPASLAVEHPDLILATDILVPNESEAGMLTGIEVRDLDSAKRAALRLMEQGPAHVLITLGTQGCLLFSREKESGHRCDHIAALRVEAVDTVAAGDAFIGALACRLAEGILSPGAAGGLLHGRSVHAHGQDAHATLLEAARWATHAAAISVTRRGAQPSLPLRSEIERSFTSGLR